MLKTIRSELEDLGWIIRMLGMAAVAGAVYQELRRPPEERTWHGRLLGFLPYDFRIPTPGRFVAAWWNPRSAQVVGDPVFGVGWSVNLAALADRIQDGRSNGAGNGSRRRRKATTKTAA
jgi:hypothetical protein